MKNYRCGLRFTMLLDQVCGSVYRFVPYKGDLAVENTEFLFHFQALDNNRSWVDGEPPYPGCNPRRVYVAGISTQTRDLIAHLVDIERREPEEGSPWLWILYPIGIQSLNGQSISVALQALAANKGRFSSLDDCRVMVRRIHDNPPGDFPNEESKNNWYVRNVMRALGEIRRQRISMRKKDSSPDIETTGGQ
jgi:hypothetical protein